MSKELKAFNGICCNTNQSYPDFTKQRLTVEKALKALEIIKECFDLNGFDELVPNSKWFESEEKQKMLKEVLL